MTPLPEDKLVEFLMKHGKSLIGEKLVTRDGRIFEVMDVTPTGFKASPLPAREQVDVMLNKLNARWN